MINYERTRTMPRSRLRRLRAQAAAAALAAFSALALLAAAPPAAAQEPQLLGRFGDWAAFTFTEDGKKVCYMASRPTRDEGDYSRRGDIYALVTHRPEEQSTDVVSFIAGYTYQPNSEVSVAIGGEAFRLFTHNDTAWARDELDTRLVQAIRRGASMVVKGTSSRGTLTTDTYSLSGSNAAYEAISQACGVAG